MSIINTVEWFHINEEEIDVSKDFLVTDGVNVEIKWFNGDDWDSWSEKNSNICNDNITHFAEIPYI